MKPNRNTSALLSLIGVMLLWPCALTKSFSSSTSPSTVQGEGSPRVVKRSTQSCDSTYDNYCLNHGQCMLLVDIDEHHCKCEGGFYGPRCSNMELVFQPMREEQIIIIIFCVCLLIVGLSGTLYFCCKWYKKRSSHQQKMQGYKEVLTKCRKQANTESFTENVPVT
ncbi:proepiregulin-like [Brachionichthys hirsutus]|uniref:proepiregulin-like n=1 Tax=Brachionichthys hirsutus TaxID=412623 RepID=UPI0036049AE5